MRFFYVDDTGFHRESLDEILANLVAGCQGTDIDVSPSSPDGQWLRIIAQHYSDQCQCAADMYTAGYRPGARGPSPTSN